jgi:glutamate formiminotransferase / formiminotetrahydrofolate cyclodeaminase
MLDAGKYFLKKQKRSTGISEKEIIKIAVKSLGLDDLSKFNPGEKIIEYLIAEKGKQKLLKMNLQEFTEETASESPAPGGGSISALTGALGIALGTMVANLSSHKRGWDDRWEEFSDWAEKGQVYISDLLKLIDEDTSAFNKILEAMGLPNNTEEEKKNRKIAIQEATKYAIEVPFTVMKKAYATLDLIKAMAEKGNPNSASDVGVGVLCICTAIKGAFLNVRTNASGLEDKNYVNKIIEEGEQIVKSTELIEKEVIASVENKFK